MMLRKEIVCLSHFSMCMSVLVRGNLGHFERDWILKHTYKRFVK